MNPRRTVLFVIILALGALVLVRIGDDRSYRDPAITSVPAPGRPASVPDRRPANAEASGSADGVDDGSGSAASPGSIAADRLDRPALTIAFDAVGWPEIDKAGRVFLDQPRDLEWSQATESRLIGILAEFRELSLYRHAAECRESLCRLELLFPPDGNPTYALRQLYARADELGIGPLVAEPVRADGEPLTLWVYLRRQR